MTFRSIVVLAAALVAGCASPPPLPPPPTTAEIVQMAKEGASAEAIIQRIEALRGVYPLPASELARLRAEGVPDQVIDYMQRTFVNATWLDGWQRGLGSSAFWDWSRGVPPYGWASPYWVWR
jgi:hypothetical protein